MYHHRNEKLKWVGVIFLAALVAGWLVWKNGSGSKVAWFDPAGHGGSSVAVNKAGVQEQAGENVQSSEGQHGVRVQGTGQSDPAVSGNEESFAQIVVHITGAVAKPGVYFLAPTSRVVDVVKAAGGVTGSADLNRINLAELLVDGVKVYIPYRGMADEGMDSESAIVGTPAGTSRSSAEKSGVAGSSGGTVQKGGRVNINTANSEQLMTLSGIGPSKAGAIIRYREQHGRFKKPEDLMLVSGIGEKTFAKLKDLVTV